MKNRYNPSNYDMRPWYEQARAKALESVYPQMPKHIQKLFKKEYDRLVKQVKH